MGQRSVSEKMGISFIVEPQTITYMGPCEKKRENMMTQKMRQEDTWQKIDEQKKMRMFGLYEH